MAFWDRYEKLCLANNYKPISEQAAQTIGIKRQNISAWKKSGRPPQYESIIKIADAYGVSTDYLLCRTDDPTDYSNRELIAELAGPQPDALDGDVKKALAFQRASAEDWQHEQATQGQQPKGVQLFMALDEMDQVKVEGFMQGLLSQDKYTTQISRKKHA